VGGGGKSGRVEGRGCTIDWNYGLERMNASFKPERRFEWNTMHRFKKIGLESGRRGLGVSSLFPN